MMGGSCRSRLPPRTAPLALEPHRLRALLPRHRRGLAPTYAHGLPRLHHAQCPCHRQGKPATAGQSRDQPDRHPPHLLPPHPPPPDLTRPPVLPLGSVSGSRTGLDGGLQPRHSLPGKRGDQSVLAESIHLRRSTAGCLHVWTPSSPGGGRIMEVDDAFAARFASAASCSCSGRAKPSPRSVESFALSRGVHTSSRPRSSLHTVAYGFRRWIPCHAARHGIPRRHQPMMAHLCLSSPCHESCRLTRSSWFTSSGTTPSNLIVRRTSCPIWGSKATAHNSDLQLQMKGTTTHHAAPLEDDGLYSSKVGVQELQEKNPEENPHPSMCFSSLELVMLIFSCIL